jgi:putative salt-induced outer membrane protein
MKPPCSTKRAFSFARAKSSQFNGCTIRRTLMPRRLLCLPVFLFFAAAAFADQVTLKNGDRLSGTIASADGKTLLLKSEFAGDVNVNWDAITGIESTQNLNFTLQDGKRVSGKVTTEDGKFVVASGAPVSKDTITAVRNDAEQAAFDVETGKMAHPRINYFWSGLLDTGLALTSGNSSALSYTLSSKAVRETPRDKLTFYTAYVFADDKTTTPSRTTANYLRSGVRGDLNISPKVFVFAFADFESNELQHLNLRQVYGGGFGYHVIKSARTTFDVFGGASYDRDNFGGYALTNPPLIVVGQTTNSAEIVAGEEFDSKLNSRTTVSERFTFFPNMSDTGQYRYQFTANSATAIKKWLSWQVTFADTYLSNPPVGLNSTDILLSTGLRVNWGKTKL